MNKLKTIINVYNINWETDGKEVELPSKYQLYISDENYNECVDDEVLMNDYISDKLSNKFGWLINDYDYKITFVKTLYPK